MNRMKLYELPSLLAERSVLNSVCQFMTIILLNIKTMEIKLCPGYMYQIYVLRSNINSIPQLFFHREENVTVQFQISFEQRCHFLKIGEYV